jgi:hypothetical protein
MPPARRRRERLAPLDPDAFLTWCWRRLPPDVRGSGPLTVDDLHFEFGRSNPELLRADVRRMYVRLAARARRNQRLGLDPMEGVASCASAA